MPVFAALRARACSGCGRANAPLTRWPVLFELGSATLRSASPADEITLAVVDASYVWPTPGVNGANIAAGPSDSDSVAGTVPPAAS